MGEKPSGGGMMRDKKLSEQISTVQKEYISSFACPFILAVHSFIITGARELVSNNTTLYFSLGTSIENTCA